MRRYALFVLWLLAAVAWPTSPVLAQGELLSRSFTLADLGYADQELLLPKDYARYEFTLPTTWQVQNGSSLLLNLRVRRSAVAVTVVLDGTLVRSFRTDTLGSQQLELPLPPERFGPSRRHRLEVRIDKPADCNEERRDSVLVGADSQLRLNYALQPLPTSLAAFPFPLIEQSIEPDIVQLVLPDTPNEPELRAAAALSSVLGAQGGAAVKLWVTTASDLREAERAASNIILIGQPTRNPLISQVTLPVPVAPTGGFALEGDAALAPGDAVIQLVPSPWNGQYAVLVVSGLDDAALERGARALGAAALPDANVAVLRADPQAAATAAPTTRTLAELGYNDQTLRIVGEQVRYRFELPAGWNIDDQAQLQLRFAQASPAAPSGELRVALNSDGRDAAVALPIAEASGALTVPLRPRQLRVGENTLVVQAFPAADAPCSPTGSLAVPTTILSDTQLVLSHSLPAPLATNLRQYPAPLSVSPAAGSLLFALPAEPTIDDVRGLMRLAAAWGAASGGPLWPQVRLGAVPEQELAGTQVVAIGIPETNALVATARQAHPLPTGNAPDANDHGWIQLVPSPWDAQHSLLVITGSSDVGVLLALDSASNTSAVRGTSGSLARIDTQEYRIRITAVEPAPVAAPPASEAALPTEPVPTATVIAAAPTEMVAALPDAAATTVPATPSSAPSATPWVRVAELLAPLRAMLLSYPQLTAGVVTVLLLLSLVAFVPMLRRRKKSPVKTVRARRRLNE